MVQFYRARENAPGFGHHKILALKGRVTTTLLNSRKNIQHNLCRIIILKRINARPSNGNIRTMRAKGPNIFWRIPWMREKCDFSGNGNRSYIAPIIHMAHLIPLRKNEKYYLTSAHNQQSQYGRCFLVTIPSSHLAEIDTIGQSITVLIKTMPVNFSKSGIKILFRVFKNHSS